MPDASAGDPQRDSKLVAVNQTEKTITIQADFKPKIQVKGEEPHNRDTFKVSEFTRITTNGLKADFSQLKPGMRVFVTIGMTRDVAAAIDAFETPPKGEGKKSTQFFSKITPDVILAIDSAQIKVAQKGGQKVEAYQVTPTTQVTMNGKRADIASLKKGMNVVVNVGAGGNVAASINVQTE